ncbi:hypothetical protein CORT_0C03490 [Candida orthopsilosis Co 90-125]|uniref:Peptide hydrolase n=1 Tax=Candida orthopsilosis (strain 90-125) TaxID=1136231 RepID=H8X3T5_CANO9|nr:hypothetical protein CORT_0C03490 [Candida orthopsilosis Co 90-125]CCG25723.1 hypothetical protein CORT_0C03490 [Candida orthopsilosis Co 90-125]
MTDAEVSSSVSDIHSESHPLRNSSNKPNAIFRFFNAIFRYRKTSLSFFVILTLILGLVISFVDNSLEYSIDLPKERSEQKLLDECWVDLQAIAENQHPYASSGNDAVHHYLKSKISNIIHGHKHIDFDNDLNGTNKFLFNSSFKSVAYYESNNLLVKIEGSNPQLPGFLLSAHFDSVPTSFGVTDDGMGVASLLGVLRFLVTQKQPKRTIIFNFNNNEEFGLYGATAFVNHPWFNKVGYFINLEGTGAGGKAILFRGTDYGIVKYFNKVRYPYASSVFQQGFANSLIHSETDYKVYREAGLRGLDLAFFKPRDLYHTAEDNIKNVDLKSLWHMVSNAIDFTTFIAENEIDETGADEAAVYTSILNTFYSISSTKLTAINTVLVVLFAIVNGALIFITLKYKKWHISTSQILFLPISLLVVWTIVTLVVAQVFQASNPLLPTSRPLLLVATIASISTIVFYLTSRLLSHNLDLKLVCILEVSFIYWVSLVYITRSLFINKSDQRHSGEFAISILFLLEAATSLLGLSGWMFSRAPSKASPDEEPLLDGASHGRYTSEDEDEDERGDNFPVPENKRSYDWSLQYLLTVPISFYIVYNSGWLILQGVNKTVQESAVSQEFVYLVIQIFSIALVLPFIPFVRYLNRLLISALFAVALIGSLLALSTEPFNEQNPLKIRFLQTLNDTESTVHIYGRGVEVPQFLTRIPSVEESKTRIDCLSEVDGIEVCSYKSSLFPNIVSSNTSDDYLEVLVKNSSETGSFGINFNEVVIKAPKNRMCNIEFPGDEVKAVLVKNDTHRFPPFKQLPDGFSHDGDYIYKDVDGIRKLYLNKLDWNSQFDIGVYWLPGINDKSNVLDIYVECFWADLSPVSEGSGIKPAIPAYDELVHYSPNYVSIANKERGLVSVGKQVELK